MCRSGARKWRNGVIGGVLAILSVACWLSPVAAETLVFHNDCGQPVVVQVSGVCRGVFHRDRPHLLHPGDETEPGIVLLGDKVVAIFDAKAPNHLLFQGALPGGALDRHFRIVLDPSTSSVHLQTDHSQTSR